MAKKPKTSAAPIAATSISIVAFERLQRAPENVRHTDPDEGIEELAEDITGHGLLQSLIGYEGEAPDEAVYVVGGGRRFAALRLLAERGTVTPDFGVPVTLRPRDEAVELSLAENLARRDMNPADEFVAFEALLKPGTVTPADLAKRFGFTERYVKQRLRLAQLAPEILTALRERAITLDAAMAYASTQDQAVQLSIFKAHSRKGAWDAHKAEKIRRDIAAKGMTEDDPRFRFVGPKAYERAGGGYEDDLFLEHSDKRVLSDPALVGQLAQDHIDFQMVGKLSELQTESPSVTGYIVVPGLQLYSWGVSEWGSAPTGFEFVDKYDADKIWSVIRNNNIPAHVLVGIDQEGKLAIWMRKVAVPKEQVRAIMGDPQASRPGYTPMSQEQIDRETREREILRRAQRIAIPGIVPAEEGISFAGTPIESRVFWPDRWNDDRKEVNHPQLGDGYFVPICVFVSKAETEAKLERAAQLIDADAQREKAEREARERQRAEGEAEAEKRTAALIENPPAVVVVADGDGEEDLAFLRTERGSYVDQDDPDIEYEDLGDLLDAFNVADMQTFETAEAFNAAYPDGLNVEPAAAEGELADA
jgi:ParB family chromosome partitioning protein